MTVTIVLNICILLSLRSMCQRIARSSQTLSNPMIRNVIEAVWNFVSHSPDINLWTLKWCSHFCVIGLISCETWQAKLTNKNYINKKQKAWQEHKHECHAKPAVGHINNNQEKHEGYLYSKLMSSTRNDRRRSMNTDKNMRTDQNKRQTNISKEMTMNMKQENKTRATNLKFQPI